MAVNAILRFEWARVRDHGEINDATAWEVVVMALLRDYTVGGAFRGCLVAPTPSPIARSRQRWPWLVD